MGDTSTPDVTAGPVGMFDSGVGGLSILAEVHRLLPAEPVIYLADQAWAPYGERSLDELRGRSFAVVDHLLGMGAKVIVVACNTASAAALRELRLRHPDRRFVGMEPAMKPAAEQSGRKVVGVLATTATFQGELYASVIDRHAAAVTVVERPGTGLVELIEAGESDGPRLDEALRRHLAPMLAEGIDTLVLGCTHYPFVAGAIRRILGSEVRLIDPAPAVARQLGRVLAAEGMAVRGPAASVGGAPEGGRGVTTYLTTGDAPLFALQAKRLLDVDVVAGTVRV